MRNIDIKSFKRHDQQKQIIILQKFYKHLLVTWLVLWFQVEKVLCWTKTKSVKLGEKIDKQKIETIWNRNIYSNKNIFWGYQHMHVKGFTIRYSPLPSGLMTNIVTNVSVPNVDLEMLRKWHLLTRFCLFI